MRITRRGIPVDHTLRLMALASLANTVGSGAMMSVLTVYLARTILLPAHQVALILSMAAVVGMVVIVPLGHLADLRGPRPVLVTAMIGAAVVMATVPFATSFPGIMTLMCFLAACERAGNAARNGMIPRIATGGEGVLFKAYLRSVTNLGVAVGALAGGVALWLDTPAAYRLAMELNALSFLVVAVVSWFLPRLPPAPRRGPGEPRLRVLHDIPYVTTTLLISLFSTHFIVIELAVPLSLVQQYGAPPWIVAVILILTAVVVTIFQLPLSRNATTVRTSARWMFIGSFWVAAGVALMAIGIVAGERWIVLFAVLGAIIHVVGEMISTGGQWGIQMGLAPQERQGQYQAFGGLGLSLSRIVGPMLVTALCVQLGVIGWLMMSGILIMAAALVKTTAAWATRTRAQFGVLTHSG